MEDAAGDERDKLLVRVLAGTVMRLGELRGLTVDDLRLEGRKHHLKVRGKSGRERLVPISPALHQRPSRYIQRTYPHLLRHSFILSLDDAHNDLMRALLPADEMR